MPAATDSLVKWDMKRTDIPLYDIMMKYPDYHKREKGRQFDIVFITPDEYMRMAAALHHSSVERELLMIVPELRSKYAEQMGAGYSFPIPVLDFATRSQEGRHRAMAAKDTGAGTIPVMMVRRYPGEGGAMSATVKRTDPALDAMVRHLGYEPADDAPNGAMTDEQLVADSQKRLMNVRPVPENQLTKRQACHLALAQAAALEAYGSIARNISAAVIPPASDRVRTAAVYHRHTQMLYIDLSRLNMGRDTIAATVHELGHWESGADDGETAHHDAIGRVASKFVNLVGSGKLDRHLVGVQW